MSSEDAKAVFGLVIIVAILSLISGVGVGQGLTSSCWKSEAVARGVAGYDEKTGEWKWTVERKVSDDEQ